MARRGRTVWSVVFGLVYCGSMWGGAAQAGAEGVFDEATEARLVAYVEATMQCRHVPGLTLAVVKDNSTWSHGFGLADVDSERKVTNQSQFGIGSCTKAFTMTLLGLLLDEHGFSWSSKVRDVLGYELRFTDELRTREMTIRDLLSHRTGLARLDIGLLAGYAHNATTRAGLSERIQFLPARYDFRDKFLYNNYMFMICGYICEVLGNDSWENLVTSRILKPLGMTSTIVMRSPSDIFSDTAAQPHVYRDGRFEKGNRDIYDIFPTEPAGALLSTGEDMARWLLFQLRRGRTEAGDQLLSPTLLDEAIKGTTVVDESMDIRRPEFPEADLQKAYGYAWFADASYRGYRRFWHSGGLFSHITYLWVFPETRGGIYASVNGHAFKASEALKSIFYYVSDLLHEDEPWMNETTACTFPEPWREKTSKNATPEETGRLTHAQDYVGQYGHRLLPDIHISVISEDPNKLRLDFNRLSGTLRPSKDSDRFLYEITSPWEIAQSLIDDDIITTETNVTFIRNSGQVTAAVFSFEVNVTFTKGVSFVDQITNGGLSVKDMYVVDIIVPSLSYLTVVFMVQHLPTLL